MVLGSPAGFMDGPPQAVRIAPDLAKTGPRHAQLASPREEQQRTNPVCGECEAFSGSEQSERQRTATAASDVLELGAFSCRMNRQGGYVNIPKIMLRSSRLATITVLGLLAFAAQPVWGTETAWPDLSGDWATVQSLVATADLPIVGNIFIDTIVGALTHITQSGSSLVLQDRYCFTDATPSTFLFTTQIADQVMQSIHPEPRQAELMMQDCDLRLVQDWYTETRGAALEDPWNDPLPTDPQDPRLVDLEGDGHPGMTIQASILGVFSGEGYAVQRYSYRLDGSVVNADMIVGFIDWTSEQVLLAATHPLFMETFTDGTDPDATKHRFVMVRVDEEWTAQTLREHLPELLSLLDF
jgi:hypothetical protein